MHIKRIIIISIIFIIGCVVCGCPGAVSKALSLDAIENCFDKKWYDEQTIVIEGVEELEDVDVLAEMLFISDWKRIEEPQNSEEMTMCIVLSEEYLLELYSSYVSAYYGYSGIGEINRVFYEIPEKAQNAVMLYLNSKKEK